MKQAFRLSCAAAALFLVFGAHISAEAQTPSPTPTPSDTFAAQLTSSPLSSFAGGISGNGRLVVIESTGDIATDKVVMRDGVPVRRDNPDGNREIFLLDYGQRRIYQITDTRSALRPAPSPTPTPTPSPSPSPTPSPTPGVDPSTIAIEISNNRPVISNDGRWIVFSSNAPTPGNYTASASDAMFAADANQEIFLYHIPDTGSFDLTSGLDAPFVDLTNGTFTRVTDTPASRASQPGTTTSAPFVADDNRSATINDDGSVIAFTSTRNLVGNGNPDGNPEVFLSNRTTGAIIQGTNTRDVRDAQGRLTTAVFNENPQLSGNGAVLAFISNADLTGNNNDDGRGNGNAEIYTATFSGSAVSNVRQATRTRAIAPGVPVNLLSPGRRISRNGDLLAFESTADLEGSSAIRATFALFVYEIGAQRFNQVNLPAAGDLLRFPTFTGDNGTLVFASVLNFSANGGTPSSSAAGLNPDSTLSSPRVQLFSTPLTSLENFTFTRLTNSPAISNPLLGAPLLQPFVSNTRQRIVFNAERLEFGGGNSDGTPEVFYLLAPNNPSTAPGTVSFFTGASNRPVVSASPSPTPPAVAGVAPGMIVIARPAASPAPPPTLAPSEQRAQSGSESQRRPALPIELNGVSVAINGAAAGMHFVSADQINFVVPLGLAASGTGSFAVTINNNGTLIRGTLQIVATQPDIGTTTMDAGGRAIVLNVTNPGMPMPEPPVGFPVTSPNGQGMTVATVLEINLTGVRNVLRNQITVRIGTTDITGDNILCQGQTTSATLPCFQNDMPGIDKINVRLPAALAGAGDVPVIVTVTISGQTFTSRPAETASQIRIQ